MGLWIVRPSCNMQKLREVNWLVKRHISVLIEIRLESLKSLLLLVVISFLTDWGAQVHGPNISLNLHMLVLSKAWVKGLNLERPSPYGVRERELGRRDWPLEICIISLIALFQFVPAWSFLPNLNDQLVDGISANIFIILTKYSSPLCSQTRCLFRLWLHCPTVTLEDQIIQLSFHNHIIKYGWPKCVNYQERPLIDYPDWCYFVVPNAFTSLWYDNQLICKRGSSIIELVKALAIRLNTRTKKVLILFDSFWMQGWFQNHSDLLSNFPPRSSCASLPMGLRESPQQVFS